MKYVPGVLELSLTVLAEGLLVAVGEAQRIEEGEQRELHAGQILHRHGKR